MPTNQWVNFAEIRARVSLEDVILRYYQIETLKRFGPKLIGPCPLHGGDSPRAFHADLDKNVYHCFTRCPEDRRGGNQIDFVVAMERVSVRDAALKLQAFFLGGISEPAPSSARPHRPAAAPVVAVSLAPHPAVAAARPAAPTRHDEDEEIHNPPLSLTLDLKSDHPHLLVKRKLQLATVEHFGIGYCNKGLMRGTIAIPIHDELGELVAYAGRRLKPVDIAEYGKYKLPKGFHKELVLYNLHRAKDEMATRGLIVVEGYFKILSLFEVGFKNVVATMGASLSERQAKLLLGSKDVVLLFDGNDAGWQGALAARDLLLHLKPELAVRLIRLPSGMQAENVSAKMLRWLINGVQALDLHEVSYVTRLPAPPPAAK